MRFATAAAPPLLAFAMTLGCGGASPPPAPTPLPKATSASTEAASPAIRTTIATPAPAPLGQLDFPVTGTPECQRKFREGMLAIHSFLYDQAHETFAAALAADAGCAMAAWGDAMTNDHPIWHERALAKGQAALARVTHEDALTPKERAYLGAARALFTGDDVKAAHAAWHAAAEAMHKEYPSDDEVSLQYALSLLSVYGYDPAHVRGQMEAGAIALDVLARRPEHPGAAHYAIHAFDSRDHAILALPAARTYARIAPAAGHAQHMPSHTFTHLGMWREVVPSNERAYASQVVWEKAHENKASNYDWHSYSWLVAALLELGQPTRARHLVDDARALLVATNDDNGDFRLDYTNMVAAYVTQTEKWADAEALLAPVLAPALGEGKAPHGPVACAMHAPGGAEVRMPSALFARFYANVLRAEAAIHAGDKEAALKRVADAITARTQTAAWAKMIPPFVATRWDAVQAALTARASAGEKPSPAAEKKALDALQVLVRDGEAHPGAGPAWLKTARETLGEVLLAWGKPKESLSELEHDLDTHPNRAIALLGAARAAKAAGDLAKAREHYATLADLWRDADADLPALAEVRAGAK